MYREGNRLPSPAIQTQEPSQGQLSRSHCPEILSRGTVSAFRAGMIPTPPHLWTRQCPACTSRQRPTTKNRPRVGTNHHRLNLAVGPCFALIWPGTAPALPPAHMTAGRASSFLPAPDVRAEDGDGRCRIIRSDADPAARGSTSEVELIGHPSEICDRSMQAGSKPRPKCLHGIFTQSIFHHRKSRHRNGHLKRSCARLFGLYGVLVARSLMRLRGITSRCAPMMSVYTAAASAARTSGRTFRKPAWAPVSTAIRQSPRRPMGQPQGQLAIRADVAVDEALQL